jgi:hypothetical protein
MKKSELLLTPEELAEAAGFVTLYPAGVVEYLKIAKAQVNKCLRLGMVMKAKSRVYPEPDEEYTALDYECLIKQGFVCTEPIED